MQRFFRNNLPFLLIASIALSFFQLNAQETDTVVTGTVSADTVVVKKIEEKHSPVKASLFSFVVPGLGQAYNKKYWKIPIIYGGIGVCMYFAIEQNTLFIEKRNAYRNRLDSIYTDRFSVPGNYYSDASLLKSMDVNRRNRDLMLIISLGLYVIQIADASVDAHLFYFNVSDDLSLNYMPYFQYSAFNQSTQQGLSLTLNF